MRVSLGALASGFPPLPTEKKAPKKEPHQSRAVTELTLIACASASLALRWVFSAVLASFKACFKLFSSCLASV